jgi:hypothetical protein
VITIITKVRRALFGWRPGELQAEYAERTRGWRCWCGMPKCAWSDHHCPRHASAAEREAWTQHPDFAAWRERCRRWEA